MIAFGAALAALASLWGVMLRLGGTQTDREILRFFYAGGDPVLSVAARWLTELGGYPTLATLSLVGIILLLRRGLPRHAALLFALVTTGPLFVELQKGWIGRLRPQDQDHLVATQSYAFPSGHSANTLLIWLSLALLLAPGRTSAIAGAVLLAALIGCTRMMLGVHWPTDVVGGYALGLFWLLLLFRLFRVPLRPS